MSDVCYKRCDGKIISAGLHIQSQLWETWCICLRLFASQQDLYIFNI